jgi:hypothetical protein
MSPGRSLSIHKLVIPDDRIATFWSIGPAGGMMRGVGSVTRLSTFVELNEREPGRSVRARLDAVLVDGRHVVLLDDRGWGGGRIEDWSVQQIELTARTVVGPDEPLASRGQTAAQMAHDHWQALERKLAAVGVDTSGLDLGALPHDVELGPGLRERLDT